MRRTTGQAFVRQTLTGSFLLLLATLWAGAHADDVAGAGPGYLIQPGDILQVSVWREPDMQSEVMVRPDGRISLPLIGEMDVADRVLAQVRVDLAERLKPFMPDAAVNVAVKQPLGNRIYVIGQVNRPGEFVVTRDVDVLQALSLAAGTTKFADLSDIKVLRRAGGEQKAIPFNYDEVIDGERLEQNIVLRSGDVVVVP
jgi:polysaccharide export outer membrane protein